MSAVQTSSPGHLPPEHLPSAIAKDPRVDTSERHKGTPAVPGDIPFPLHLRDRHVPFSPNIDKPHVNF